MAPQQQDLLPVLELARLLVKHFNHTEGLWQVSFEFQWALGSFGPTAEEALPGALFQVKRVGLARVQQPGPLTVDAAAINPPSGTKNL